MTFKLYPYQQEMVDAVTKDGFLFIQMFGRAVRPILWHLMQSDPCDDWSEALGLNGNGLYPEAVYYLHRADIDSIRGYGIDLFIIDEVYMADLQKEPQLRYKDIMGKFEPMPYDYQRHNRVSRKDSMKGNNRARKF